ncbi:hypothetical protein [Shewanella salipaludis]|uniref:Uncharacterized protein n=1 Tax=Shewanella salipaludis TaxID=2723052 RepID=A0A972JK54_9GAMM|nr:hypothetical protein [Shewanella salipaludis]NMH63997.1 hypothetical protein [Shewanella salipaludis]
MNSKQKIQADWWSKSLIGGVLGFSLALALSSLLTAITPGGMDGQSKVQFNMWMVAPIWMFIFSFSYLFRSGLSAMSWLTGLNLLSYSLLLMVLR